jgi:hypothetical protein
LQKKIKYWGKAYSSVGSFWHINCRKGVIEARGSRMPEISGYGGVTNALYQRTNEARDVASQEQNIRTSQTIIKRGVEVVLSTDQSRLEEEQYLELNKPQTPDRPNELSPTQLRAIEDLEFERRNATVEEPAANEMSEAEKRALEALL